MKHECHHSYTIHTLLMDTDTWWRTYKTLASLSTCAWVAVEAKADELKVVRVRSKDHEILIAPEFEAGRCFTLVVFHRLPNE